MASRVEEQGQEERAPLVQLTTEIVAAYVSNNAVAMADLGPLIESIGRSLETLGREDAEPLPAKPKPAVPVRRSVQEDLLVCLVCGKPQKVLRRHLGAAHGLTPAAYRELFGLRSDYPMAAPSYSRARAEMAQRIGLGQRRKPEPPGRKRRRGM